MGAINAKKFGLAVGLTFAILHLGCVMVILFAPRETTIAFFNTLLHCLDVTSILRTDMSAKEMAYGFSFESIDSEAKGLLYALPEKKLDEVLIDRGIVTIFAVLARERSATLVEQARQQRVPTEATTRAARRTLS